MIPPTVKLISIRNSRFASPVKKTARGLHEKCVYCGSADVEGIARLTKYFSKISSWNKGKLAELKNRKVNDNFDK